jgi:hypothetical protein
MERSGAAGEIKPVLEYHDYLALTAGFDAEWTRKTSPQGISEGTFTARFQRVFDEIDRIAGEQKRWLSADSAEQKAALRHLYEPVHSLPVGHADALTLMLLDDFDPIHEFTARCSTTVEEIAVAFCPKITPIVDGLKKRGDAATSSWRSLCEPDEMVELCLQPPEKKPPLVMFMRFKLNGWGAFGLGLLFEAALLRAIVKSIAETMTQIEADLTSCGNDAFAKFEVQPRDLNRTRFCILDVQGQEELAIWCITTNFTIPMAVLSRIHAITVKDVFEADETEQLRSSVDAAGWFASMKEFAANLDIPKVPLTSVDDLTDNHVFRWTRTTLGVSKDGFERPDEVGISGFLSAVSILQTATGHQHEVDKRLDELRKTFRDIEELQPRPGSLPEFHLHAMGQGDLLLHHRGFRVHEPDMLVRSSLFFNQVRETMRAFVEQPPRNRRDLVGLSSVAGVPVPVLLRDGKDFYCPEVSAKHSNQLEMLLPALRWRIAPDAEVVSSHELRQKQRLKSGTVLTSASGGLSLDHIRRDLRLYSLPESLIRALEFLYQNYATLLANPFVFDAVLDLYDAFATLHRVLTKILPVREENPPRRLHFSKVNEIAKFVGTLHRALEHRLYRAYPEEHHRDMDVDFRGGLNELLFAADAVQKCAIGLLRNCVLEDCQNKRDTVGVVMSIGFQPGILARKLRIEPERVKRKTEKSRPPSARLAIIDTDVPHVHHVPSYLDFLHEAFHLVYDELRNPTEERGKEKRPEPFDFLPTVPPESVLDQRLSELFVHSLMTLLVCRDKPELLTDHLLIQYSTSAWTGSAEEPRSIRLFVELACISFVARSIFGHLSSDERWWASNDSENVEAALREKLEKVETPPIAAFESFLRNAGPLSPDWKRYWENQEKKGAVWEFSLDYFSDFYRAVVLFLPQVLRGVHEVFQRYQEYAYRTTGRSGGKPPSEEWLRREKMIDDFILAHGGRGAPLAIGLWRNSVRTSDFLTVICRYLRNIANERLLRIEEGAEKEIHFPPRNESGAPQFIPNRAAWARFLILPGSSALWCDCPVGRRKRLLTQICALKTFWDASTSLRASRLAEMMIRNLSVPKSPAAGSEIKFA